MKETNQKMLKNTDNLEAKLADANKEIKRLKESEKKTENLFNFAPMPYIITDKNGKITKINKAGYKFFGDSKKNIKGKFIRDFLKYEKDKKLAEDSFKLKVSNGKIKQKGQERMYYNGKIGKTFDHVMYNNHGKITDISTLIVDITEQRKLEDKLKEQLIRDPLTGLYNRYYYEQNIGKLIKNTKKEKENIGFSMYDLNNFKYLNDNFGHLKGDKILKDFAHLLSSSIKSSDIPIRVGGDEFLVISPNASNFTQQKINQRLEKKINLYNKYNNQGIGYDLSVSTGYALRSYLSEVPVETIVNIADKNMYQNKANHNTNYT